MTDHVNDVDPEKPAPSVAVMSTDEVPAVVGVPEMVPVEWSIDSPAGRPVALKELTGVVDELSVAPIETGVMAEPETEDWDPGVATDTVSVTVQAKEAVPANPAPSVAARVTEHVHGVVGVPVIEPVEELIDNPAGSPVADHERVAPDWVSVAELVRVLMAVPVTFDLAPGLVTVTVLVTFHVKVADPLKPAPSVAFTVTEHVHGVVGVPVIEPVEELIDRPAGSPVADHVRVAPDWESAAEFVTVPITVPVTFDLAPGLVTVTVLDTFHVKVVVADRAWESVAVTVTVDVPGVVGVPLTTPPEEIDSPDGRPVAV